jgi:hypothetical protein
MMPRIPIVYAAPLYDERGRHLGDVAELGNGQFAAFNARQRCLGIFDERPQAERLVLSTAGDLVGGGP